MTKHDFSRQKRYDKVVPNIRTKKNIYKSHTHIMYFLISSINYFKLVL